MQAQAALFEVEGTVQFDFLSWSVDGGGDVELVEHGAGKHEVELAYEPRSVKLGCALGALGWLALAVVGLRTR